MICISFFFNGEIKIFSDKQTLGGFVTSRPTRNTRGRPSGENDMTLDSNSYLHEEINATGKVTINVKEAKMCFFL